MNLNRAMIIGNLTRDPETRMTPTGQNVAQFGVATNRSWMNKTTGQKQEEVEFHQVVVWGKLAEICSQYLGKGRKVYVEGRLKTREWVGQDGVKRSRTEIIADNVIMLDRGAGGAAASEAPLPVEEASAPASAPAAGEEEIKVEDIPF